MIKLFYILIFVFIPFFTNVQSINKIQHKKRATFVRARCNLNGCYYRKYKVQKRNKKTRRRTTQYILSRCKSPKKKRH